MVTYCIGSARQKCAYFRDSDAVVLDNSEVLFCASENGRNYFAIGKPLFASYTVEQYVKYKCAATPTQEPDASEFTRLGISPHRRIGRLAAAEMRAVDFLAQTGGKTDRAVVVNLDGTKYSRRCQAALDRLIRALPMNDLYVCVSDRRFLKHAGRDVKTLEFGKRADGKRPSFYSARILAARLGAKKVCIF